MDDFDTSFPDLYGLAYRVAFRLLGNREESEEVAQEALARAGIRWHRLVRRGRPDAWVVRVAGRLAVDVWRRRTTRDRTPIVAQAATSSFEAPVMDRMVLHEHLARLPRRQREVVVLRYVGDLSEAAVAAALGCSVGAVKQHASRGLTTLRQGVADVRTS